MTLILCLLGCPYVSNDAFKDLGDQDGDGLLSERFNGPDCDDTNPERGSCDADEDGARARWAGGDDCDDDNAAVFPGAIERCDGVDNDCDQRIDDADEDVVDLTTFYVDADGDGFGTDVFVVQCDQPPGHALVSGDCNDGSQGVSPAEEERCDPVDRNCDGSELEGAFREWYADDDGDGFGDDSQLLSTTCDRPTPTAVDNANDCDDTNALAHPTGTVNADFSEVCDGIDNDCDGLFDDDDILLDPNAVDAFVDLDLDGFGDPLAPTRRCALGEGFSTSPLDCDDTDPLKRPGPAPTFSIVEVCDGFDNDCNGLVDTDDPNVDPTTVFLSYPDADGDGFGATDSLPVLECSLSANRSTLDSDCDDDDVLVNPSVAEQCATEGIDDDCDGLTDSLDPSNDGITFYQDQDRDGVGVQSITRPVCPGIGLDGFAPTFGDCNDLDGTLTDPALWYADLDGDGFGDPDEVAALGSCFPVANASRLPLDCEDTIASINPNAVEICDGVDNDCNGNVDQGSPGAVLGYPDVDGDGFGDSNAVQDSYCTQFNDVVASNTDCDDSDATRHPGVPEDCTDVDRNCTDGPNLDDPLLEADTWYADNDLDGFGNPDPTLAEVRCDQPPRTVLNANDCDDTDPATYFSDFFIGNSIPDNAPPGAVVTSMELALQHPGRCQNVPTTVSLTSLYAMSDPIVLPDSDPGLVVTADGDGELCMGTSASFSLAANLTLRDLPLQHGLRGPSSCILQPADAAPFQLVSGGELTLEGMNVTDTTYRKGFITFTQQGISDTTNVHIGNSSFTNVVLGDGAAATPHGFLKAAGGDGLTLDLERTDFTNVTSTGSFLNTFQFGASDWTLHEVSFNDVTAGGPLVHTLGEVDLDIRFVDVVNAEVDGALICMDDASCTTPPVGVVADVGPRRLDVDGSNFINTRQLDGTPSTLFWLPESTNTFLIHNTFDGGTVDSLDPDPAPVARIVDTAIPNSGEGWSSRQNRYLNLRGGLAAEDGFNTYDEDHFYNVSDFSFGGTHDVLDVTRSTFVDSNVEFVSEDLTTEHNLFANSTWAQSHTGALASGIGVSTYVLPTPPAAECSSPDTPCQSIDPDVRQLVSYDLNLPTDRWIIQPRALEAGEGFTYADVEWRIDPNADGLPVAWLVFHASTLECRGMNDLFLPNGDPDQDGLLNAQEYIRGTWPCDHDTDGDFVLDLVDDFPLDSLLQ